MYECYREARYRYTHSKLVRHGYWCCMLGMAGIWGFSVSNNNYRPKTYFTETEAKEINRRNKDIMTESGKAQLRARTGAADHKAAIELGLTITEYYKYMGVV